MLGLMVCGESVSDLIQSEGKGLPIFHGQVILYHTKCNGTFLRHHEEYIVVTYISEFSDIFMP